MTGSSADARQAAVARSLAEVRRRIGQACAAAGRPPGDITLIAITKTYPVTDAQILLDLGVADLGENRASEARDKAAAVPGARWHFVGQLQTNKAKLVARFATAVHSLDRAPLVDALDRAVAGAGRDRLDVFLQVSLDGDPARGGIPADGVDRLADLVATTPTLRLRGLMAVAPQAADPNAAFARLRDICVALTERHPGADAISAGMSGDLEAGIANGATHVRVGTALLGLRPPIVS